MEFETPHIPELPAITDGGIAGTGVSDGFQSATKELVPFTPGTDVAEIGSGSIGEVAIPTVDSSSALTHQPDFDTAANSMVIDGEFTDNGAAEQPTFAQQETATDAGYVEQPVAAADMPFFGGYTMHRTEQPETAGSGDGILATGLDLGLALGSLLSRRGKEKTTVMMTSFGPITVPAETQQPSTQELRAQQMQHGREQARAAAGQPASIHDQTVAREVQPEAIHASVGTYGKDTAQAGNDNVRRALMGDNTPAISGGWKPLELGANESGMKLGDLFGSSEGTGEGVGSTIGEAVSVLNPLHRREQ